MQEKLKEIKQSFRLYMNGVTAQSLRDKGVNYHLNWGVSLQHLQEMTAEIKTEGHTPVELHELSILLWKENIRECKILDTMLMPAEEFPADLAMLWVEQTPTQEIAELAAMNLYQHLPYAKDMALQLIAQPYEMAQLQGYCIMARLLSTKMVLNDSELNEFIDQAHSTFKSSISPQTSSIALRHSILNAIQKLSQHTPHLNDYFEVAFFA
jgi:hypothetical protein